MAGRHVSDPTRTTTFGIKGWLGVLLLVIGVGTIVGMILIALTAGLSRSTQFSIAGIAGIFSALGIRLIVLRALQLRSARRQGS